MALPAGVSLVTVTLGPFLDFQGNALGGQTVFTPSSAVLHTATGTPVLNKPIVVPWGVVGTATVQLPATDDLSLTPINFVYSVQHSFEDRSIPTPPVVPIQLPRSVPTVDLDLLIPASGTSGVTVNLPAVQSVAGYSGTVTGSQLAADPALRAASVSAVADSLDDPDSLIRQTLDISFLAAGDGRSLGIFRPENYGALGDDTADDGAAINACLADAAASGGAVSFSGRYRSSVGLVSLATSPRIAGVTADSTVITFTGNAFDYLTIGTGAAPALITPAGYVRDLALVGPTAAPSTGKAALKINALRQVEVRNVRVDNQDIGFDLVGNCYGAAFHNIRSTFGSTHVGLNLRAGGESGSDLSFYDAWLGGSVAAVHISGGGGGYHFYGGQLAGGGGLTAADDTRGSVIIGKDYLTGATGEASVEFFGTSFEGTSHVWCVRGYDQFRVAFDSCSFTAQNQASPGIGVLKGTNFKASRVAWSNCAVGGYYSNPALVVTVGGTPSTTLLESGTYNPASAVTIAGTKAAIKSLLEQSTLKGVVIRRNTVVINGIVLTASSTALQQSLDGGTTLVDLATGSGGSGAVSSVAGKTGAVTLTAADIVGGTFTDAQIPAGIARDDEVANAVAALVASAPGTLDTLDELAAALGDDPNFATTVMAAIGAKYSKPAGGIPAADLAADVATQAELDAAIDTRVPKTAVGTASGVAGLDSTGHLPYANRADTALTTAELHGLLAVSCDPAFASGSGILVAGLLYLTRVPVRAGLAISSLVIDVATAGSGASAFAGVYDAAGNLLGQTGDIGTAGGVTGSGTVNGANNVVAPLTAPVTAPADGYVYVGLLGVSGTAQPTPRCSVGAGSTNGLNLNLITGTAGRRSGTTGTGLAALPATFNPTTLTGANRIYLIGVK